MKALGLNPAEQEMIDMTNEVAVNGLVYFPDFCKLVLRKYREDSRELLNQTFFKVKFSQVDLFITLGFYNSGYLWYRPLPHKLQSKEVQNQGQILQQG